MKLSTPLARVAGMAGMLTLAALALVVPRANAQIDTWDHYKVYRVSGNPVPGPSVITLKDQFGIDNHPVFSLDWFANPVQKQTDESVSPINDIGLHYAWWRIDGPPLGTSVVGSNQFGDQTFFLSQPRYLWNPALKNESGPLPVENHYKCYDCLGQRVDRQVTLTDQFGIWQTIATDPRFFCTPAEKTHPDGTNYRIEQPDRHYVCYELQPPDPRTFSASIQDQFLPPNPDGNNVQLSQAQYLCVPTEKVDPTPVVPGTWGRVKIMYR